MIKRLLGTFAAAALLFGFSSCSDELELSAPGGQDGDLVEVTFTITEDMATSTRADEGLVHYPTGDEYPQISDGSKAKRLIWAVYDTDGNILPELGSNYPSNPNTDKIAGYGQVVEDVESFPHKITITLVRGQEYSFVFWAQDANCKAFDTKDLRAVTVDYKSEGNNLANDELRDAFCKVETFTVTSAPSQSRTIILKRPFAQINVGIPANEYEALRQSGVRIMKSKIHIENVATEFDVWANSTNSDDPTKRQAIDYDYNFIPAYYNFPNVSETTLPTDQDLSDGRVPFGQTQDLKVDLNRDGTIEGYGKQNGDGKDETFNYLMMCYILPADRNDGTSTYSTTLDRVDVSFLPENDGQAELSLSLDNVPVQRNWRTNIFGQMFTSEVNLVIDLDPFYSGDYNYPGWERIYEGVTYDGMEECIYISNGAGLVWLSKATNGGWADADAYDKEDGASSKLFLQAVGLEEWPDKGVFHFKDVTIKLDADIDLATYASLYNTDGYFDPIGFGGNNEFNQKLNSDDLKYFAGTFDGQNHTIYNLKTTRPADLSDDRSMGLFSTVGRTATIKNVRLKNIDIEGYYRTGGIVGLVYSAIPQWGDEGYTTIDNCYVDGGIINVKSRKTGENSYDDANNIGGICGQAYNGYEISNCFVRNLTIRGYRALSGILGQTGGDYPGPQNITNNKVYNVTLIADQFMEYGTNNSDNKDFEIVDFFVAKNVNNSITFSGNEQADNKLYGFSHPVVDGKRTTTIDNQGLLTNPPLDIFPRLARYTDVVLFKASVLGGPSAYKVYTGENENVYRGDPDKNSGRVGLWMSGVTLDGTTGDNLLDHSTITASDVNDANDCVLFIKDEGTVKNLTLHGATYAGQAICIAPATGKTITLDGVLAYDAKQVLTDDGKGGNGSTLDVKNSNFRGYVKLGDNYNSVTFEGTTFDGSTKRADESTINKLESAGKVTLTNCEFLVASGSDYVIDVPAGSTFDGCTARVVGTTETIEITGPCTISVNGEGKVSKASVKAKR